MRHLYIGLIVIFGCSPKDNDFNRFVGQLETLQTPISLGTMRFPERQTSQAYDKELFRKFKYSTAHEVYGKIYEDDKAVGIIYSVIGDINVPILVTYDKQGSRIDSLNLFENASGFDFESETYEHVTFFPNKTIQVIDSIKTWKTDETGEDRVPETETLTIDTLIHRITGDGKIVKDKRKIE
jgi:hypothetical protein